MPMLADAHISSLGYLWSGQRVTCLTEKGAKYFVGARWRSESHLGYSAVSAIISHGI